MKQIKKLRKILCEIPEIKEDLMKVKFGTIIKTNRYSKVIGKDYNEEGKFNNRYRMTDDGDNIFTGPIVSKNIIGNKIQERHLFQYCNTMGSQGKISREENGVLYKRNQWSLIAKLDNTKDLEDQSSKVIKNIINFLKENNYGKESKQNT